jgi:hypothetical protein
MLYYVRFEVPSAEVIKMAVPWDVALCGNVTLMMEVENTS